MKEQCKMCKKLFPKDMIEVIETPNYFFYLCLDCAIDLEDKMLEIVYPRLENIQTNCPLGETIKYFDNSQDISNTLSRGVEEGSETHISSSNPNTQKGCGILLDSINKCGK